MIRLIAFLFPIVLFMGFAPGQMCDRPISLDHNDTNRIFVYGTIRDRQSKEPFEHGIVVAQKSDTSRISRAVQADQYGNYKIDVTTLVDSTKTLTIRSWYINCAYTHIIIKGKVTRSLQLDIDIISATGHYYVNYKLNSKTNKLRLINETAQVTSNYIE